MYLPHWAAKVEITILEWCSTTLARHRHNPPRANLTMIVKEECRNFHQVWRSFQFFILSSYFVIRSYHRAMIDSFGRPSFTMRPTLHLDFQMFHHVIEAMVGLMSLNLFEHQICNSLTSYTMHLFLCTQNTWTTYQGLLISKLNLLLFEASTMGFCSLCSKWFEWRARDIVPMFMMLRIATQLEHA